MDDEDEIDDELSFISTDRLLNELGRRHDHVVFASLKVDTEDQVTMIRRWKGNPITALGLCEHAKQNIHADIEETGEPGDVEDL